MKLIRAQCGAQSGPSQRAELCSVWPKWNIDILSHNAASTTQFSQLQFTSYHNMSYLHNITTNRWYIVCFQHWHCSSLDRVNFKTTLHIKKAPTPIFQISHFLLCPKDDFIVSLQLCRGFPHCKITSVELAIALQGFAKIWEINNCHFNLTCIKQLMRVEISK